MATMRYIADLQHEKLWDGKKEEEMSKFNAIGCKKNKKTKKQKNLFTGGQTFQVGSIGWDFFLFLSFFCFWWQKTLKARKLQQKKKKKKKEKEKWQTLQQKIGKIFLLSIILRGYCTPDHFFDCLCIFPKNYDTLVTSKICFL